jgi:hypothetical protein
VGLQHGEHTKSENIDTGLQHQPFWDDAHCCRQPRAPVVICVIYRPIAPFLSTPFLACIKHNSMWWE